MERLAYLGLGSQAGCLSEVEAWSRACSWTHAHRAMTLGCFPFSSPTSSRPVPSSSYGSPIFAKWILLLHFTSLCFLGCFFFSLYFFIPSFLSGFIYQCEDRFTEKIFHRLFILQISTMSRPKPGVWNFIQIFYVGSGTPGSEPSSVFLGILAGSWVGSGAGGTQIGTHMGCRYYRWWPD